MHSDEYIKSENIMYHSLAHILSTKRRTPKSSIPTSNRDNANVEFDTISRGKECQWDSDK